jgi:1,4-dihydroxy-2-naphthoyl-CoA hydrolase
VPAPMGALFDLQITGRTADELRAQVPVTDALKQPLGLVHGGVFASIADALAVGATENAARALSNQASFLRPVTGGTIHATARRRHTGRTTAVWEVDIADDDGRLCALVRVTVAVAG